MSSTARIISRKPSGKEEDLQTPAQPTTGPRIDQATLPEPVVNQERIAQLAYSYWEARDRPAGSPLEDWLRAEHDIQKIQTERPSLTNLASQLEQFN